MGVRHRLVGRAAFRGRGDIEAFDNPPQNLVPDGAFVDGLSISRVTPGDAGTLPEHVFPWALTESAPPVAPAVVTAACPCAGGRAPLAMVGDPDGWFHITLPAPATTPLDVRLTLSGASTPTGSCEEIGIAALEVYVR